MILIKYVYQIHITSWSSCYIPQQLIISPLCCSGNAAGENNNVQKVTHISIKPSMERLNVSPNNIDFTVWVLNTKVQTALNDMWNLKRYFKKNGIMDDRGYYTLPSNITVRLNHFYFTDSPPVGIRQCDIIQGTSYYCLWLSQCRVCYALVGNKCSVKRNYCEWWSHNMWPLMEILQACLVLVGIFSASLNNHSLNSA